MIKNSHPRQLQKGQTGFTLIEVLVAAIVLAVGLLGLAGLNATSQRLGHSASQYSHATLLAYEIADAIRANARNVEAYDGRHEAGDCERNWQPEEGVPIANSDIAIWLNRLGCALPGAVGTIDVNNNQVTVTINWDEGRARGDTDALEAQGKESEEGTPCHSATEDQRSRFCIFFDLPRV